MGMIDRLFAALLALGAVGHALASLKAYGADGEVLLWALSASAFMALLAALNWLRAGRPSDLALARITFGFGLVWCLFIAAFAFVIHRFFDVRVIGTLIVALGLVWFSVRNLARGK
jgi:hypothetical protein